MSVVWFSMRHLYIFSFGETQGSGKEVETVVNEPCLEIVYENFVLILLSGTSWREWLCGSILHLNISDICSSLSKITSSYLGVQDM